MLYTNRRYTKLAKTSRELERELMYDAIEALANCLEEGYTGYYCDLHHEVFNTDYYVSSSDEAMGIFDNVDNVFWAIGKIWEYEKDNFGEIYCDFADAMKIMNMLHYIIGEEAMYKIPFEDIVGDYWNEDAIEEINEELAKAYREYLENNF